jgi:hypothetical protein
VTEAQKVGAIPMDGTATETRVALKIVFPEIMEPIEGEFLLYGVEWSNSDVGNGTHSVRGYAIRVVCANGMTRDNLLKQVHIGGRLGDDVAFSDRTYKLDSKASVSALRDVVKGVLGPAGRDAITESIRAANTKDFTAAQLANVVRTQSKATVKAVVDAFTGPDVVNLPAGDTAWRGSNAISWIARNTQDAEQRLDLERLAGSLA